LNIWRTDLNGQPPWISPDVPLLHMTPEFKPEVAIGRDRTVSLTSRDLDQLAEVDTRTTDLHHKDLLASTEELAEVLPKLVVTWVDTHLNVA